MTAGELADLIQSQIKRLPWAATAGAIAGAKIIQEDAKARIGHYQGAVGEFPAWAPLADATKADRVRKGFSEDDPLLRSGELRDAIEVRPHREGAIVGIFEGAIAKIAVWMELGSRHAPPRPFLGPATIIKGEAAVAEIDSAVAEVFGSKKP
jgi:hypothetical protein